MLKGYRKNKHGYTVPKGRKGKGIPGPGGRDMTRPQKKKEYQNPKTPNY